MVRVIYSDTLAGVKEKPLFFVQKGRQRARIRTVLYSSFSTIRQQLLAPWDVFSGAFSPPPTGSRPFLQPPSCKEKAAAGHLIVVFWRHPAGAALDDGLFYFFADPQRQLWRYCCLKGVGSVPWVEVSGDILRAEHSQIFY